MRILTWNCNLQFSKKSELIKLFDADVIVIQECERLSIDYFEGYQFFWTGKNEMKGLAIVVRGSNSFIVEGSESRFAYFLPVQTEQGLVIGVWAFNHRAKKFGTQISGYISDALSFYDSRISDTSKVVIAGDFNNGPRWDLRGFHKNNFRFVQAQLEEKGFRSSYHVHSKEFFGEESMSTYFHQRDPDKKYHIDYVFSKGFQVDEVKVGDFKEWCALSDHVPLFVRLAD